MNCRNAPSALASDLTDSRHSHELWSSWFPYRGRISRTVPRTSSHRTHPVSFRLGFCIAPCCRAPSEKWKKKWPCSDGFIHEIMWRTNRFPYRFHWTLSINEAQRVKNGTQYNRFLDHVAYRHVHVQSGRHSVFAHWQTVQCEVTLTIKQAQFFMTLSFLFYLIFVVFIFIEMFFIQPAV